MSNSLNDLYADYSKGLLKKEKFEAAIFKTLQKNIHRFGVIGWNKEESDDYISYLYLRINQAINTYKEIGSSFETYIKSMVRMTAKEFRARQARSYVKETAAWITQVPEMYVCENESEYNESVNEHIAEKAKNPAKFRNPRQLLILILKCCNHVSVDFLERIAPRLGIEPNVINEMIERLKKHREKRETEIIALRERVNRQFYRCILFEKRLQTLTENSHAVQQIKNQLEQERNRLNKSRRRLMRTRLDPSNAQIAKLLGLSKSTVDSTLHILKKRGASSGETIQKQEESAPQLLTQKKEEGE